MKFTSKTEDQIMRESLLEAGDYDFEVIEAKDTVSKKSGKEMIALNLKVFRPDGGFVYVRDYLLEAMAFKLIHFCRTAGLGDAYKNGELTADACNGRAGKVRLIIEEQPGYSPRNAVKDYVAPKDGEAAPTAAAPVAQDDGVPW